MYTVESLRKKIIEIEGKIGYVFKNKELLILSFIHRSYVNECREKKLNHNERLEFLGDSVLSLIISDYLYKNYPNCPEGELSRLRSRLVDAPSCVRYLQKLSLGEYVLLGKGEKMNDGRGRETIYADLFEALIGAIYLDSSFDVTNRIVMDRLLDDIQFLLNQPSCNWKAELQDYSQKKYQKPPQYRVVHEAGPDHSKIFHITVLLDDKEMGLGVGPSKKEAEQAAAEQALLNIK